MQDYAQLSAQLAVHGIESSASEVHGFASGAICAGTEVASDLWQRLLADGTEDESIPDVLTGNLGELLDAARKTLGSDTFEFKLLLPPDDHAPELRLEELTAWCRGYALGLFADNRWQPDKLPGDASEIARDIMQIAAASAEIEDEDLSDADRHLTEIEEYLRVGVQLIYEELHDVKQLTDQEELQDPSRQQPPEGHLH